MSRFEIDDDSKTIVSGAFRLLFHWDGERWSHEIQLGDRRIALSQESDPERGDPSRIVSPTYQQCHTQEAGNSHQALLVGLWGAHHCSAVFQLEETPGGEVKVEVDVAARSRATLLGFASTYRIRLSSQDLISADSDAIAWRISEPAGGELRLIRGEGTRLVLAEAGRRETVVQMDVPIDPSTATQRLTYGWRWRPGP